MSKYREYLTHDEREEFDTIVGFQEYYRQQLREMRKKHIRLIWIGRGRAKAKGNIT